MNTMIEYLQTQDFHNNFMQVVQTVCSIVISVGVAIFTLSTSFLVSKTDEIADLIKDIEDGGHSLSTSKKRKDCNSFFSKMKAITKNALLSLPFSLLSFLMYIFFVFYSCGIWELTVCIPTLISIYFLSVSLISLTEWYIKFHKRH